MKERLKQVRQNLRVLKAALTVQRKERDKAVADLHDLHDAIVDTREEQQKVRKLIEREASQPEPDNGAINRLTRELDQLGKKLKQLHDRTKTNEIQKKKAIARAHELVERQKFLVKKKTTLRKKIKKAKEQTGDPKFETWMANGYDSNVTQGVKDFIARGVVRYDLTCTSLRRTYVPPGGSTTSFHLQTPGRAGDIAGARMTEFQISEYQRNLGNSGCLELFGPDNTRNLKYGNALTLGEGTGLENLHDSHVHGAF